MNWTAVCGILFPQPGNRTCDPCSGVLTTRLPGKSFLFFKRLILQDSVPRFPGSLSLPHLCRLSVPLSTSLPLSCSPCSFHSQDVLESVDSLFTYWCASLFSLYYSDIWRRQWHPTPVLLPRKSHGRRSLVGCSPWGRSESDTTEQLHFHFSLSCIGEGNGNPLQFLPGESQGWRSLVGWRLWGLTESDTTEVT